MAKLLFGVTLILLCAVGTASAGDEEVLKETSAAWEVAFNAADAKTLATFYATDAMLLPPNTEFVEGRESIMEFWAPFITTIDGKLDIKEAHVHGDLAVMIGTFELTDSEGNPVDRGKYIEVWKRGDGKWEIYRDIWNSSGPKPEQTKH
jgi:uncharacterized protein (TIGR02246 family)